MVVKSLSRVKFISGLSLSKNGLNLKNSYWQAESTAEMGNLGCKQIYRSLIEGCEFESCLKQNFFFLIFALSLKQLNIRTVFKRLGRQGLKTNWLWLHFDPIKD